MGFFSSIISFVKKVISSVLTAIAKLFNGVFGSPIVAALAMFVVGFMVMGPAAFAAFASNPLLYLSQCLTLTMFVGTNLVLGGIIGAISALCPDLGKVLGFAFGLISFFMGGFTILELFRPDLAAQLASYAFSSLTIAGVDAAVMLGYLQTANAIGTAALLAGLMAGTNADGSFKSPIVDGYVDGVIFVPEIVADVADTVVEAATTSLSTLIGFGVLAWVGYKAFTAGPNRVVVEQKGDY